MTTMSGGLVVQSVTLSALGPCPAKCHRFEPPAACDFLSIPFILKRMSLFSFSVHRFSRNGPQDERNNEREEKFLMKNKLTTLKIF